jgi:ATP-dependent Lon protease
MAKRLCSFTQTRPHMDNDMLETLKKDHEEPTGNEPLYYPLLPLRDVVVFPNVVVPLFVGRENRLRPLNMHFLITRKSFLPPRERQNRMTRNLRISMKLELLGRFSSF